LLGPGAKPGTSRSGRSAAGCTESTKDHGPSVARNAAGAVNFGFEVLEGSNHQVPLDDLVRELLHATRRHVSASVENAKVTAHAPSKG
jgi:hypothetical protein